MLRASLRTTRGGPTWTPTLLRSMISVTTRMREEAVLRAPSRPWDQVSSRINSCVTIMAIFTYSYFQTLTWVTLGLSNSSLELTGNFGYLVWLLSYRSGNDNSEQNAHLALWLLKVETHPIILRADNFSHANQRCQTDL